MSALCAVGLAIAWVLASNPITGIQIDSQKLDTTIATDIANQTGNQVSVDCPNNQAATAGDVFLCSVSEGGSVVAQAQVTVLNSNGDAKWVILGG